MARFTTREDAKNDIVTAIEGSGEVTADQFDIDAISYEAYAWKIDSNDQGQELLDTGGFEQVVDEDTFWQIVEKHEKQS